METNGRQGSTVRVGMILADTVDGELYEVKGWDRWSVWCWVMRTAGELNARGKRAGAGFEYSIPVERLEEYVVVS